MKLKINMIHVNIIYKDKNVLKEYLESREQEVLDMLMELYDQEEVMRSYLESERYEAAEEAQVFRVIQRNCIGTPERRVTDGNIDFDRFYYLYVRNFHKSMREAGFTEMCCPAFFVDF